MQWKTVILRFHLPNCDLFLQHHLEFAAQLETFGMWHWSLFVLLHLHDPLHRKSCVKDVLCRHIRLWDSHSEEREEFLVEKLKIPVEWIAEAKALCAATAGKRGDQVCDIFLRPLWSQDKVVVCPFKAWYLIKAKLYSEAHDIIVKWIAPDAIINADYEFFFELLKELSETEVAAQVILEKALIKK